MFKRKRNAFTLIELVAILVIMAIIALIVTPLVMSIIRKARISADKRSIDAYGRSIELAIASYLMDTGSFPTSVDQLTIEYSGDKVECETTQINSDSSIYLAGCTVVGRSVGDYTYGKDENQSTSTAEIYNIGDLVTYNGVDYYVLKDSDVEDNVVTLLKAEPLTVAEVNTYGGVGTDNNHVNKYATNDTTSDYYQTAFDYNGYGAMAYYTSETCGYDVGNTGCTNSYDVSDIKYVVDAWAGDKVSSGLSVARIITKEEYEALTDVETIPTPTAPNITYTPMYDWQYNNKYWYWTMSSYNDSIRNWIAYEDGGLRNSDVYYNYSMGSGAEGIGLGVVRPVVELYKNNGITKKNSGNN